MVRQTRNKRKTRRGGKFVGKGSYGCGFAPPLRCKGDKTAAKVGEFSKLMESKEALKEFVVRDLLEPIDPRQDYFLYPSKLCRAEPDLDPFLNRNTTFKNLRSCNLMTIDNPDARLIFYKDGGPDLTKIEPLAAADYADFFLEQIQLLHGLRILHTNHICHLDIKQLNLVLKKEAAAFRFRYIDFGAAINTSQQYVPQRYYEHVYQFWPPEMRYINKLTATRIPDFAKIVAEVGPNENQQREYLLRKVDVFSLSIVLDRNLKKLMGLQVLMQDDASMYTQTDPETGEQVVFNPPAASKAWFDDVKETIMVPYVRLTQNMRNPSPYKRFTIDQALADYTRIRPNFRRLFTEDNIRTHLSIVKPHLKRGFINILNKFIGPKASAKVAPA